MATSPRMRVTSMRVTWTGIALVAAISASVLCASLALLVRSGLEFALCILAAGAILLSAFACRRAAEDSARANAKVSDDVTAIAQRLLRVENRAQDGPAREPAMPAASLAADLDAITRVVSSLAEAVGVHDERLGTLEKASAARVMPSPVAEARDLMGPSDRAETHLGDGRDAPAPRSPSGNSLRPRPQDGRDSCLESGSQDDDGGSFRRSSEQARPAPSAAELSSRDDFARAASAILGRLRGDPPPAFRPAEDEAAVAALEAGAVELHLQPVVMLPQRRTAFYDTFPHLRRADGTTVAAAEVADLLLRRGQRPRLDAFTLTQACLIARHLAGRRSASRMAVRLSRASLGDAGFVQGAARLMRDGAAERLILTVDHSAIDQLSGYESAALDALGSLGATLALDAVGDLDQDWSGLQRRGFSIAMLDARVILGSRPHGITLAFTAEAARSGIQLVATGIDDDAIIPDLLDFDLPLAVGSGLAPPRPVRSEVLAGSPPAEAPEARKEAPAPPREEDGPVSFRDFLRRAG